MNVVKTVCASKEEEALAKVAAHKGVLAWYGAIGFGAKKRGQRF